MRFKNDISDSAALAELGRRIARYRLNRNQSQAALATEAGVSVRTLHRIEHGQSSQASNLIRVLRALGLMANLEALIPAPIISPLQQVAMHKGGRQRASSTSHEEREAAAERTPWSWGDDS